MALVLIVPRGGLTQKIQPGTRRDRTVERMKPADCLRGEPNHFRRDRQIEQQFPIESERVGKGAFLAGDFERLRDDRGARHRDRFDSRRLIKKCAAAGRPVGGGKAQGIVQLGLVELHRHVYFGEVLSRQRAKPGGALGGTEPNLEARVGTDPDGSQNRRRPGAHRVVRDRNLRRPQHRDMQWRGVRQALDRYLVGVGHPVDQAEEYGVVRLPPIGEQRGAERSALDIALQGLAKNQQTLPIELGQTVAGGRYDLARTAIIVRQQAIVRL